MIDSASRWIREVIQLALVVVALGVVLQILFPQALVFINADVTGNLIGLIGTFFFYNYIFKIIYVGFSKTSSHTKILSLGVVCSLLLLQSSQNYLRVYFWIHLGIVLGYYLKDKYYSQPSESKLLPQMH